MRLVLAARTIAVVTWLVARGDVQHGARQPGLPMVPLEALSRQQLHDDVPELC